MSKTKRHLVRQHQWATAHYPANTYCGIPGTDELLARSIDEVDCAICSREVAGYAEVCLSGIERLGERISRSEQQVNYLRRRLADSEAELATLRDLAALLPADEVVTR